MTDLAHTLRAAADEPGADELDLDTVHARAGARRRRRVRARAGVCVVGALVVVAGIGLAAGAGPDTGGDVRAGEPEGAGFDPEPTGSSEPTTSTTTSTSVPTTSTSVSTTSTAVPTTTSTAPPPSTEATPPPTAPETLAWTYVGTEQWRLGQPDCPQITHRLDAEAIAADGAPWAMREDYCGVTDGDRWNGAGTWSLTAADGTSLSGTYTSSVDLDGPGEPYTMTIEGGTGRFAGARGTCAVVVNLTPLGFGSQQQDGTIDCTVTVAGTA